MNGLEKIFLPILKRVRDEEIDAYKKGYIVTTFDRSL